MSLTRKMFVALACWFVWLRLGTWPAAAVEVTVPGGTEAMHVWRAADGLPSDAVTAIIQTREGFLWIGTSAGLVRFDGVTFTTLPLEASTTNAAITALCEDSDGHLWIGTQQDGVFEQGRGRMRHFEQKQGLCGPAVTSLAAGQRGQVWIGTKTGLNLWTGEAFRAYRTREGLPADFVSGVSVARSGTVWIATRLGMCRYVNGRLGPYTFQTESQGRSPEYLGAYEDRHRNLWAFGDTYLINLTEGQRFNYFRTSESASIRIWSLCEGQDGRLWIGTSGRGLYCFEGNRFQPVVLGEDRWPYDVRALCEDKEGDLWLGTSGGGLVQLKRQPVRLCGAEQGLPASLPTALAVDRVGQIYVGLERGGLFRDEAGRFDHVAGVEDETAKTYVTSIVAARDGTIWAATLGNGLYGLRNGRSIHLTTADGLTDDGILALCEGGGWLWVSARNGTLQRLDESSPGHIETVPGAPPGRTTVLSPSAGGGFWLGTSTGQVWRESAGVFVQVKEAANPPGHAVLALYESAPGCLWIGKGGGGLGVIVKGRSLNWDSNQGMPSDVVAGVITDHAQNLWFATDQGVYRVTHENLARALDNPEHPFTCELMANARALVEPQGFLGEARSARSQGELWFATAEGLVSADTGQGPAKGGTFPVMIEAATFNREPALCLLQGPLWSVGGSSPLPARTSAVVHSLEVRFTALNFESLEATRFRHKLEGVDLEWVDDGHARVARYGRLPYGQYRFRVAARMPDGKWQESAQSFAFVVPTPVYYQIWALCLYALAVLGMVATGVRVVSHRRLRTALARLEQQQMLERERLRIARDMHDEIGSKLTKISFLSEIVSVDAKSPGALGERIQTIARTSRDLLKTMDEIVWVVNPHNDTLENLSAYLSHYAAEYFQNTPIECELRLPEELPAVPLSSETRHNLFLTFEEALNNVLKHSGATRVRVEMAVHGHQFELTISDNGKGFDSGESAAGEGPHTTRPTGNGLRNMRQRLAAIGGECHIASQPGAGATVTVRFKFPKPVHSV
ncbi:MAG TPA: two-component regulator propeller domain-containing protein [Verrucomicrobiae bacterium]|nr:two-component regulator propeller domain-containing protein [Verrucomicrobiae bacterium]